MQIKRFVLRLEMIWEGDALTAYVAKLASALSNELILVKSWACLGRIVVVAHDLRSCEGHATQRSKAFDFKASRPARLRLWPLLWIFLEGENDPL